MYVLEYSSFDDDVFIKSGRLCHSLTLIVKKMYRCDTMWMCLCKTIAIV